MNLIGSLGILRDTSSVVKSIDKICLLALQGNLKDNENPMRAKHIIEDDLIADANDIEVDIHTSAHDKVLRADDFNVEDALGTSMIHNKKINYLATVLHTMVGIVKLTDENVDSLIGALGKDVCNKNKKRNNNDKKEVLTKIIFT